MEHSEFAKILDNSPFQVREGYEKLPDLKVAYKFGDKFPEEIEENWREVREAGRGRVNKSSESEAEARRAKAGGGREGRDYLEGR